jgi:hypothetical protein
MVPGDVQADALSDLRTARNALSVWNVDPALNNLSGVLTALASNRDQLDKVDYTLIDENLLPKIAIECVKSPANTAYLTLNAHHRDLIKLTAGKIAALAREMMPLSHVRVPEKKVRELLRSALRDGLLDRSLIKAKLIAELESDG